MALYELQDSGNRQQFSTGSRRDTNENKPRYDLISLPALERVAEICRKGAQKYGDHNWRLGQPTSRFYESAFRHLMQWAQGNTDEDHLAQAVWNLMSIAQVEYDVNNDLLPDTLLDHERYDPFMWFRDLQDEYAEEGGIEVKWVEQEPIDYDEDVLNAIVCSLIDWRESYEDGELDIRWPSTEELTALARDQFPCSDQAWAKTIRAVMEGKIGFIQTEWDAVGNRHYKLV